LKTAAVNLHGCESKAPTPFVMKYPSL
jgi:hypothetical protein